MLNITIPPVESYDETKNEFVYSEPYRLQLEHSLVSLSKWESKWLVPFLGKGEKTTEQIVDYVRCMTITQNVPPDVYYDLSPDNIKEVRAYIEHPMTATKLPKSDKIQKEIITAELIYYWMIAYQIPCEYQKWHLNRLLTLINVCSIKNEPPKKRSKAEILEQYRTLNAARRAQLGTTG